MSERTKRTVEVWNRCECGKVLLSIREATRGECSACWFKAAPSDTKVALNRVIGLAFKPATDAEKDAAVKDAMDKLQRDEKRE